MLWGRDLLERLQVKNQVTLKVSIGPLLKPIPVLDWEHRSSEAEEDETFGSSRQTDISTSKMVRVCEV